MMAISTKNRTKISTDQRLSRYVQGGLTDKFSDRVGWWERFVWERQNDDIIHVISSIQDRRPSLVAKLFYGQERLTWLVLQYNNIVDIETEFRTGTEIRLPTQLRVFSQITTQPVGGKVIR
jgi:hypothetical protein